MSVDTEVKVADMQAMTVDRPIAPDLPELSPQAELALLARVLFREGYDDHLAGHITYRQADETLFVNPFGLTWDEIRARDVMRMSAEGRQLDGSWTISPAVTLHVEFHKVRHDAAVAIHNHPRWGTIWADLCRRPEIYDQTGAMYHGEVAIFDDYLGSVDHPEVAQAAVKAMGDAGVLLIVGADVHQAYLRAVAFEWRCRQAWHVAAAGGGRPMRPEAAAKFGEFFNHHAFTGLFEAMARRELRADPAILD